MLLEQKLKEIREKMGTVLKSSRDFAARLTAEPDKAAEHQAAFDKAFEEFRTLKGQEQQTERELEVERETKRQNDPVSRIQTMAGPDAQETEKRVKALHTETFKHYLRASKDSRHERSYREKLTQLVQVEQHMHLGTVNEDGGFLVPDDFKAMVIQNAAGFAVVRSAGATSIPTSSARVKIPTIKPRTSGTGQHVYTSGFLGDWKAQGSTSGGTAPATQAQPKFGMEEIPVHDWRPDAIEADHSWLEDAGANVEQILAMLIGQTKGLDEDYEFLLGTGVGRPEGVLTAGISTVKSKDATKVTYGGLVDLFTGLPAQYRQNAKFVMNSATFGAIIQLETTAGFLIFPPNSAPGTMFNRPVLFSEFLADVGAAAKPIVFGDWSYYYIAERADLRIQRLEERFAPNLGILPWARVGGQVVVVDAFRTQVISV